MRVLDKDSAGPGIDIEFTNPPTYIIGSCTQKTDFTLLGTENYRIWTFKKQDTTLQLLCNGVEIFNFNYGDSPAQSDCKSVWSRDFAYIRFTKENVATDTASDLYRNIVYGKLL